MSILRELRTPSSRMLYFWSHVNSLKTTCVWWKISFMKLCIFQSRLTSTLSARRVSYCQLSHHKHLALVRMNRLLNEVRELTNNLTWICWLGRRKAEDFIDKLNELNQKRRGISSTKNNRQRTASLNLSGA